MDRFVSTARHQLRSPPADFTGRVEELDDLLQRVGATGVTISALQGQGGIGKTALALKLAEALRSRYPDAQIDIDLKGASAAPLSPAEVMAHVIHAYLPNEKLPEGEACSGACIAVCSTTSARSCCSTMPAMRRRSSRSSHRQAA
jgi:hypothetical protein